MASKPSKIININAAEARISNAAAIFNGAENGHSFSRKSESLRDFSADFPRPPTPGNLRTFGAAKWRRWAAFYPVYPRRKWNKNATTSKVVKGVFFAQTRAFRAANFPRLNCIFMLNRGPFPFVRKKGGVVGACFRTAVRSRCF